MTPKYLFRAFAALLVVLAPLACDLEKTGNQLAARTVMVATLLATPPVDVDPAAMLGFDGGLPDGGFSGDAGFPADAGFSADGGFTVPGQTAAFVFLGTRSATALDSPPEPISNATVAVVPAGGSAVTLDNDGSGNYSKTSVDDPSFEYQSGKTYEFRATVGAETFVGEVQDAPALERISQFHPPEGYVELAAKSSFTFTRPDPPPNTERNLGFVTVFPMSSDGQRGEPTYSNVPKTPLDFLELVAAPSEWKQTQVTVPGEAFPQGKSTYLVVFQSVKTGGPKSDNLFTGSAILAGTADIAVVRTK